jgi:hypothetical protein
MRRLFADIEDGTHAMGVVKMGMRFGVSAFVLALIGLSLIIPAVVQAETNTIGPQSHFNRTYDLEKGDTIEWEWDVETQGETLDFWIEDSEGTVFVSVENNAFHSGSFTVQKSGYWTVWWFNDNLSPPSITYTYTLTIDQSSDTSMRSFWWILLIIIVVIVMVMMLSIRKRARPKEPLQPPPSPPSQ